MTPTLGQAANIDATISVEMAKEHIPGATVAVVRDGKTVFAKGYGLANVELKVPATPDTVYSLLSITKQFTAMAVMLLVEEGKVGLDDTASRFLSLLPAEWKGITVRNLLSHTSDVPDYTDVPGWFQTIRQDRTPEDLLKPVLAQPLAFTPGTRFRYSNSNYYLLGLLIEKVSGKRWAEFLRERLFQPLGMSATRANEPGDIMPGRASGYHWQGGALHNAPYVSPTHLWAAGSIDSTVTDLAKWETALHHGTLLKPDLIKQMEAPRRC